MLIVVAKAPQDPAVLKKAAALTGMELADVNRRLLGVMPRVLLPAAPAGRADDLVSGLEALSFVAFACDPSAIPSDAERLLVRGMEVRADGVTFFDGQGQGHACPKTAMALVLRGVRVSTSSEKVVTNERKLDVGKAVLSGGLMLTSKVKKETVHTQESREAFLLITRNDGEPDAIIYERRIDYRFLGTDKQPSSFANLEKTLARLRALVPDLPLDDRLARPGFVTGLPLVSADPVDLGLFLVSLARTRGC
jgi:hypothetical protein